jgi:hypothetical protein
MAADHAGIQKIEVVGTEGMKIWFRLSHASDTE